MSSRFSWVGLLASCDGSLFVSCFCEGACRALFPLSICMVSAWNLGLSGTPAMASCRSLAAYVGLFEYLKKEKNKMLASFGGPLFVSCSLASAKSIFGFYGFRIQKYFSTWITTDFSDSVDFVDSATSTLDFLAYMA